MKALTGGLMQALLSFLENESHLGIAVLGRDQALRDWNQTFTAILQEPSLEKGIPFSHLLTDESRSSYEDLIDGGAFPKAVELYFKGTEVKGPGLDSVLDEAPEGYIVLLKSPQLSESEALHQMSVLNNELANTARELHRKNVALEKARAEIKTLKGLLPICSICKRIRDDKGVWEGIESYIASRSEAEFSHGICQDCMDTYYSEYTKKKK